MTRSQVLISARSLHRSRGGASRNDDARRAGGRGQGVRHRAGWLRQDGVDRRRRRCARHPSTRAHAYARRCWCAAQSVALLRSAEGTRPCRDHRWLCASHRARHPVTSSFDVQRPRDAQWADVYAAAVRVRRRGSARTFWPPHTKAPSSTSIRIASPTSTHSSSCSPTCSRFASSAIRCRASSALGASNSSIGTTSTRPSNGYPISRRPGGG